MKALLLVFLFLDYHFWRKNCFAAKIVVVVVVVVVVFLVISLVSFLCFVVFCLFL